MKGNALRRFIAMFIVVAMMLTPVLALAEEADLGIEAPVAESGVTLGEETTNDTIPEGESAPVEAEEASVDEYEPELYDLVVDKVKSYSGSLNVTDVLAVSLDLGDVEATSWKSSNTDVIVVEGEEDSAEIMGVGAGSAKVTVKLSNKKSFTISVKVKNPFEPSSVEFASKSYTIPVGGSVDLFEEVELIPDGSITNLTFSTSNKSVATVGKSSGVVVGKKAGKANITVKTTTGKKAVCQVLVVANELKNICKKPSKSLIKQLCEDGWTFLPVNIKFNSKGGIDCEFYFLNGTSLKSKSIPNFALALLCDDGDEVIAAYNFKTVKVSASKNGYKSFKVSFPASSVQNPDVFLPDLLEDGSLDLYLGVDEDLYAVASDKYVTEMDFIPVDGLHTYGDEPTPPSPTPVKVTSITLSPATLTLDVGEKSTVVASVKPDNATNKAVEWKSSDEKVATVKDGAITGIAAGTATITATAKDGSGVSATCSVTVANIVGGLSISVEPETATLKVGETKTLTATVLPPACAETLKWASSDEAIAKVDSATGVVTAVKAGEATITGTVTMGETTKNATCKVTVQGSSSKITIDPESAELVVGQTLTLKATAPEGKSVTWSSGNTTYATVSNTGVVKGEAKGKVRIIASADGEMAECIITVVADTMTDFSLDPTEVSVVEGKTATVKFTNVAPTGATVTEPSFEYNPSDVASCSGFTYDSTAKAYKFTVTGSKPGSTKVTVKVGTVKKTFTVKVTAAKVYPTSFKLTLNPDPMKLKVGEVGQVSVEFDSTVTEKDVKFTSSNRSIADYDATEGVIKAYAIGNTHITVEGAAESGKTPAKQEFDVEVTKYEKPTSQYPVESVTFEKSSYDVTIGGTAVTVKATVAPSYATDKTLVFTSSDATIATVGKEDGKITAVAPGTVTITARSNDDGTKYATCTVTVSKKATEVSSIDDIVVKKGSTTIDIGTATKTATLEATVHYSDGTSDKNVTWESKDPSIATVDSNGVVTGVKASKTPVTIVAKAGSLSKPIQFTVTEKKHVTAITVNPDTITLDKGKTATLSAAITPSDAEITGVDFSSLNTGIAKVTKEGVVEAVGKGKTQIQVKSQDKDSTAFTVVDVVVTLPVEKVEIVKPTTTTLNIGKTLSLKANVTPTDADDKTLTWKSDKPSYATVSADGVVTAVAKGEVTITATAKSGAKGELKITVEEPAKVVAVKNVVTTLNSDKSIQVSWDKATAGGDHYWVHVTLDGTEVYKTHVDSISTTTATIPVKEGTKTILQSGKVYEVTVQTTIGLDELDPNYDPGATSVAVEVNYN